MAPYSRKLLIASLADLALGAAFYLSFRYWFPAVMVLAAGIVVIIDRHCARCKRCLSWRTSFERRFVFDDHRPGFGTFYETRHCRVCRHEELVREYFGRRD